MSVYGTHGKTKLSSTAAGLQMNDTEPQINPVILHKTQTRRRKSSVDLTNYLSLPGMLLLAMKHIEAYARSSLDNDVRGCVSVIVESRPASVCM